MKALCLSGGGARGSFQMGAIKCLYTRYGYRPDMIVGTSVGAVNGVKLAEGRTPAEQLTAMQELESQWLATVDPAQFFVPRPEFQEITGGLLAEGPPGGRIGLLSDAQVGTAAVLGPISGLLGTVLLLVEASKLASLLENLQTLNSLLLMDPIKIRLSDPASLMLSDVHNGTPLYLATVSLESGSLRYVTGRGEFVEKDGVTPVASALEIADLNTGLLASDTPRRQAAEKALADFQTRHSRVVALKEESANKGTPTDRRVRIADELVDLVPQAEYALGQLRDAIRGVPEVTANVDVVKGVLASAAIPGIFDSVALGREHYVDGGVREVLPVDLAVRKGADEVVAIGCSSNRLPEVDSFGRAGVLNCLVRALIDTSLSEVVEGDLVVRGTEDVTLTKIFPSLDVHDTVQVKPALIEISMHYGFMRAGDVVHRPLTDAVRREAFELSNAITALRRDSYLEERQLSWDPARAPDNHRLIPQIRVRKWAVKALVAARRARGVPLPSLAELWAFEWERDLRPSAQNPLGMPNPWARYTSLAQTLSAVSLGTFAPDGLTFADRSSGELFELVRGAAFPTNVAPTRLFSLPAKAVVYLPKIPPGRNLLVETGRAEQWVCDGRRRYSIASPAVLAAAGMSGATPATVPRRGLDQIPDGGAPFWAGNVVVVDSANTVLFELEVTRREGSDSPFKLMLLNRSSGAITVELMDFEGFPSEAGLSVETTPGSIPAGARRAATLRFRPTAAGRFSGYVAIQTSDSLIRRFRFPLDVVASPLGEHAELSFSPSPIAFAGRVAQSQIIQLQMTNNGATEAVVERVAIEREGQPGTFQVPWTIPPSIPAGSTGQVPVSCTPRRAGKTTGALAVDVRSVSTEGFTVRDTSRIDLISTSTAPVIALRRTRPPPEQPGGVAFIDPTAPRGGGRFGTPAEGVGGMFGGAGSFGGRFDPIDVPPFVPLEGGLELDLGTVPQGSQVTGSFFVGNLGDADLSVSGFVLRSVGFYGDPMTLPLVVAPGDWVEVRVHTATGGISPGGGVTGEWAVLSDDPLRPEANVSMVVRVSGPYLVIPTDFVDFGRITAGSPASRTLQLRNAGDVSLTIDKVAWNADRVFTFSFPASATTPPQIPAGGTLDLTLGVPANARPGNFIDYLEITASQNSPPSTQIGAQVQVEAAP